MPDHLHTLTDGKLKASETLRYINGILSRRIIGYLKENKFGTSGGSQDSLEGKQGAALLQKTKVVDIRRKGRAFPQVEAAEPLKG